MSPLKTAVAVSFLLHLMVVGPATIDHDKNTGTLKGMITDPQGVVVQGVKVSLACASSKINLETLTDTQGAYRFENLPPAADCVLEVSPAAGNYSTVTQQRIVIRAGTTTVESIQLFDSVEETVIVSAKQTDRRVADLEEVGQVTEFSAEYIEGLPLLGHNYQDILHLASGGTDSAGNSPPNVLGARAEYFRAIIEGISNQGVVGGAFVSNLNNDTIEAVEIIQTDGDESLGRASGSFMKIKGNVAHITMPLGDGRSVRVTFNTESYERKTDNPFRAALLHPLSTFSIDVDTASYSNVRRFLAQGNLPPLDAVRIEEMINYFDYDYPAPQGDHPFSIDIEATGCPWAPQHRLVRVGLKGDELAGQNRPPANLVFLLDVSGSMDHPKKLPLVKRSLKMLVNHLNPSDTVAMVVYAGAAGLALPPTSVASKEVILDAIESLDAGGSTAGGAGLRLAYKIARANYLQDGINRVILATDGDFNVGVSSTGAMIRLIEQEARSGVFFTVLGFGMGNLKDDKLEKIADKGNGHYAYIDSLLEARKVLVEELGATLVTIAKDVKIQVEFNPALVQSYRLIGYENRLLRSEDFNDDTKDAGEIGAGHTVTVLYEIVPTTSGISLPAEDELKYQRPSLLTDAALQGELLTVKIRYKDPDGNTSRLLEIGVIDGGGDMASASTDTRFAAAVACLGMVLRDAPDRGTASMDEAERLALAALGDDLRGHRANFLEMIRMARSLTEVSRVSENQQ